MLKDKSERTIELTLWGDKANDPGATLYESVRDGRHPVLICKSALLNQSNPKGKLTKVGLVVRFLSCMHVLTVCLFTLTNDVHLYVQSGN